MNNRFFQKSRFLTLYVGLALIVMFISGCTVVGPDYVKPEVDVPDNWRMEVKTSAAMANVEWWHSFNDPVLDKLIDTALRNNQDVRLAAARVAEFAARVDIARAGFFPQLGYSGDGNRNQLSRESYNGPSSGSRTYNSYTAGLNIGWELDFWGKVARATEASRADLLAAEEGRKVVILTLISSVASNYLQLQSLDEQLIIAKDTVKRREQSVVLFQDKFKGGVISELEVAQVQSEYELARVRIPAIERQIVLLENALSVLIGQNPGSINRTSQSDEVTFPAIPEEIPSDILSQRPDILEAENNLIAANARIGVAKAAYFPTISLTGMLGFASESLSSLLNSSAGVWSAGGSMLGPIFSGGSIDAQLRASEAEQKQLVAQYIKSIQTALMEVEDALISVKKLKEEFNAQSRQVEALKSYSHFAQIRYNDGYVSYIEVLDSERSLFDAELELVRKQGEVLVALVSVYKSMGGGWINEAEKVANETDFPKSEHEKNDGDRQPFPSITLPTTLSE